MTPKVYLIKVPHEYHIHDRNWPIGLLYICSYLKSKDIDVSIIDLSGLPKDQWDIPSDGDYYGVSCTTPDYHHACQIADIVKRKTNAKLILGGNHATARPEEVLLASNFDIVVIGEGELTIYEIITGKSLDSIEGICYKEGTSIKKNKQRSLINFDLDLLPPPDIKDLDYQKYIQPIIMKDQNLLV